MSYVISSLLAYLIGSLPFALIIGKVFYKTDIRQLGSGNLGGTNAGRTLGKKAGISVTIFDVLKATLAMTLAYFIDPRTMVLAGFFATIGHCFPVFAGFKGGKAVSTAFGYFLGLSLLVTKNPLLHFLLPLASFFGLLYLTKIVSLSSMIAVSFGALLLLFTYHDLSVGICSTIIAVVVIVRHRKNIQRILDKTESKITWM